MGAQRRETVEWEGCTGLPATPQERITALTAD